VDGAEPARRVRVGQRLLRRRGLRRGGRRRAERLLFRRQRRLGGVRRGQGERDRDRARDGEEFAHGEATNAALRRTLPLVSAGPDTRAPSRTQNPLPGHESPVPDTNLPPRTRVVGYVRHSTMLRVVQAARYVMPFREGGSVPALVEGDDLGLYVVKLRGAGQGVKALV